ncbi:sensor domain-containing diguanylate cyclase [Oceanobacillus halotolerans]|uniref:sensor domain-containing diguanylate cyclase n=1 Tax=Oceanobacillus halotolerans TaxID=2663380 RepID=UPI0013DB6D51|nr:sensor domain-containing diguanylate cyclase [Oceanobacillus halotolerans]
MIDRSQLQDTLRGFYFDLIANMQQKTYADLLQEITNQLNQYLETSLVTIYAYDNVTKKYMILINPNQDERFRPHVTLHLGNDIVHYNNESNPIIKDSGQDLNTYIIPIDILSSGFIAITYDNRNPFLTKEIVEMIEVETTKLVQIITTYKKKDEKEEQNQSLLKLAMHFYKKHDKKDILHETIHVLNNRYPTYSHYLLLSQDYEADHTLPIKKIEYSDDATKRAGSQAFITGELQCEDRLMENRTYLYVPLIGSQGIYGILQMITPQITIFSEEELGYINTFSAIVGHAIEMASLYQHSIRLVDDLKLINDATHKLNSNLQLSEITSIVKNQIMNTCKASEVGFIYYNESSGQPFDILSGSTSFFLTNDGKDFVGYMLTKVNESGEALFSGNLTNTPKPVPYRSIMAIPMIQTGAIHGMVVIMHEMEYFFSFENFKLMQSLVHHSTLALSNTILKEQLQQAVITDYLTKLYSRNYLDEKISKDIKTGELGTLVLIDIDDFKKINDVHGHHVGDEVIVQVAQIIKLYLGNKDIPARWGGEELAIYLPNAPLEKGVQLANKIRKKAVNFTNPKITLSSGVSTWHSSKRESVTDLFIRADQALYEAKKQGKNCVVRENRIRYTS